MTSTTPIDGLADWLRDMADSHDSERLSRWASAVESLALERIAVPEGQAELSDDEILDLTRAECEHFRWPSSALAIARAILSARKDRAEALLLMAEQALDFHGDHGETYAAIRTYLEGK